MRRIDEALAIRSVVEGTAAETGMPFFRALVHNLARALDTKGAWVTRYHREARMMEAVAFWFDDGYIEDLSYDVAGSPCEPVVEEARLVHIEDRMFEHYPGPPPPGFPRGEVSYLGVPMLDTDGRVLGHVAVIDVRPMPAEHGLLDLFGIFATRATAEMRRLRLEHGLRERQEKLQRLIGGAMDAIVEMDGELRVTLMNAAAEKVFGCTVDPAGGTDARALLGADAAARLRELVGELEANTGGDRHMWVPGGLSAQPSGGRAFPAEATLSRFEMDDRPYYALILRDVDERVAAERRIQSLSAEAEYLREEIAADHGFDEIVGRSPALRAALRSVTQVADTDATVLLIGETGTGKELFARAIHDHSARKDKPLVKVNCAAIPVALMESEFFGHERGAFTGATQRREGRFALADGGTILLDEIGELPLELQGKLLRVLQEGEFEMVGGSRTRKVDVRVLAATNRDLEQAVRQGQFREDLYYRLSVFPLPLPPLRERGDDVVLVARHLIDHLTRRTGRRVAAITDADVAALRSYPWPGNVRELRNVIERAIITSTGGQLNLAAALPLVAPGESPAPGPGATARSGEVLSARQLRQLERDNMLAALESAGWRVAGADGAAQRLGISPSTFKSRMKALNIVRRAGN